MPALRLRAPFHKSKEHREVRSHDGDCSRQSQLLCCSIEAISYAEPLTFSIHQKAEMDRLVKEELQSALWITAKNLDRIPYCNGRRRPRPASPVSLS
jgi:hypothetical protein